MASSSAQGGINMGRIEYQNPQQKNFYNQQQLVTNTQQTQGRAMHPRPMGNMAPRPMDDMAPRPMGNMGTRPMDDMAPRPMDDMAPRPMGNMAPRPMDNMAPRPMGNMAPRPMDNMAPRPMGNMTPRPMDNMAPRPMGNMQSAQMFTIPNNAAPVSVFQPQQQPVQGLQAAQANPQPQIPQLQNPPIPLEPGVAAFLGGGGKD